MTTTQRTALALVTTIVTIFLAILTYWCTWEHNVSAMVATVTLSIVVGTLLRIAMAQS